MAVRNDVPERIRKIVCSFVSAKEKNADEAKKFDNFKTTFYGVMREFFDASPGLNSFEFLAQSNDESDETSIVKVTKVQKASLSWDITALRKALGSHSSSVISREYRLRDIGGLAKYVKSLGGDQGTFKSFFDVAESVDTKLLDNLSEVGEVDAEEIKKCCDAKLGNTWFKVTTRRSGK